METLSELSNVIALSMGAAWASGINLYATLFTLGLLHLTDNILLPAHLHILAHPMVLSAAGFMFVTEFFADKTPGVDTGWDALHTFIRIPAGAMLAAGAVGDINPALQLAAGILGGGLAAGTHATKAGSRVLINTSPEPFTNWTASLLEDAAVVGGVFAALHFPLLFLGFLIVFVALMIWLLPKLWRGIRAVLTAIGRAFGGAQPQPEGGAGPPPPPSGVC